MRPFTCLSPFVLCMGFILVSSAGKQPDQAKTNQPTKVDLYGDPLPEGAVARLGTVRFRHGRYTQGFGLSPDGKSIYSTDWDYRLLVRSLDTGLPLPVLSKPRIGFDPTFSVDCKLLLGQGDTLIDVATGKKLRVLEGLAHGDNARPAAPESLRDTHFRVFAFSPDGQTFAAAGENTVNGKPAHFAIWSVPTGKMLRYSEPIVGGVNAIAYLPDSNGLAWVGRDKKVHIWDVTKEKEIKQFPGHQGPVETVAVERSGKILASAGRGGVVHVWHWNAEKPVQRLRVEEPISSVLFSPDGKHLASVAWSGLICLWDHGTGKEIWRCVSPQGQTDYLSLAFTADSKTLVTLRALDNTVRQWDTATGKEIRPIEGHTSPIASMHFAADGKTLFSTCEQKKFVEWNLATGKPRRQLLGGEPRPPQTELVPGEFSADGKLLVLAGHANSKTDPKGDRLIHVWDPLAVKVTRSLSGHTQPVNRIKLSADGTLLASSASDGTRLWDVATGKELRRLTGSRLASFSPDGKMLACEDMDGTIHLFDVAAGKPIRSWDSRLAVHKLPNNLIFSSDGQWIAAGAGQGFAVWATQTGKELFRIPSGGFVEFQVFSLAFSPNGRILAAGGKRNKRLNDGKVESEKAVRLWELASGQAILEFDSPHGNVEALTFSPSGATLATGGEDSTILLWDLASQARLGKPKREVTNAAQLSQLWGDLEGEAPKAYAAIWELALAPKESAPFLKKQLALVPAPMDQVTKLIQDLDQNNFADRQKAAQALEKLGESAEAAVRKHLENKLPLEVRQRLQEFLKNRDKDAIRKLRAIEVLEQIGTNEARQVLEMLAQEAPNPRVADGAKSALARLAKRV